MQPLMTRRLDEMTSREVELYVQGGGDLIFVPFGPISGHGAFIPLGIHAHWAQALSLLVAERANGLVHPPIFTCYAGATRSFRATGIFSITEQVSILKRVAITLKERGFTRVVLMASTTPEWFGGMVAAREVFDETEQPVWMLVGERLLELPEVKSLYDGYPGNFGETQIELASLTVLGRPAVIRYPEWAKAKKPDDPDQPTEIAEDVDRLRKMGTIGFRYYEEGNHGNHGNAGLTHNGMSDVDLAVKVLEKSADLVLPLLESYTRYLKWIKAQPLNFIVPKENL
ncbi:MAG TPA: creatininase family protein [Spirochaetia bacterium]|nr:creatininase family protein [Spirochaetia bacterium]